MRGKDYDCTGGRAFPPMVPYSPMKGRTHRCAPNPYPPAATDHFLPSVAVAILDKTAPETDMAM